MKILDWRPVWERAILERWESSSLDIPHGGYPPGWTRPWNGFIAGRMRKRVKGRRPAPRHPHIVSVGNLALGGTGKTPVIMALGKDLAAAGFRGAVLTRGYRSSLPGPLMVKPQQEKAGDEARLMARSLAPVGWQVVQARRRSAGLDFLLGSQTDLDFVLLEDGHQTRDIGRHLDVVILDQWRVDSDGPVSRLQPVAGPAFPLGPFRESVEGLERAGIVLVESGLSLPALAVGGQAVATFQREIQLRQAWPEAGETPLVGEYGAISGIARPAAFEKSLIDFLGKKPGLAMRLRDHQAYDPRLVARITEALRQEELGTLVTTAKDWIKLAPHWGGPQRVWVAELAISWGQQNVLPQLVREHAESIRGDQSSET